MSVSSPMPVPQLIDYLATEFQKLGANQPLHLIREDISRGAKATIRTLVDNYKLYSSSADEVVKADIQVEWTKAEKGVLRARCVIPGSKVSFTVRYEDTVCH
jgi:hypothetical protein